MTTSAPPPLEPPKVAPAPPAKPRRSSPAAIILLYLIIVFIGAAVLSPHLYASAQFLLGISHRFSFLADPPFHRFVNRCLILLAILGLPSLFRALGFQSASVLGLKFNSRHCHESIHGFGWAFITLAVLAALFAGFEARALDLKPESARWINHLKNAALSAAIVGLLEEILFRGALFGSLRQHHSFIRAALYSSILYALLHFLARPEHTGRVHSTSGFIVLGQMLRGFTDFSTMIPAFLNLTLIGLLLALVFERTGSLLFSIGLHAGFVFLVKTLNFVTIATPHASTWFWGTNKIVDGWAATIVLLLTFLLLQKNTPAAPKSPRSMNPALPFPILRRFLEHFLALFYPEVCQMCREQRATFAQSYICEACRAGKNGIKWVEPPFCECCGLPFPGDITVTFECFNCRDQDVHFRAARSAAQFSGVVKEAIHRYKYNHASWFEPFLAGLLINAAKPNLNSADWDWIVPIPLHWRKMRQRTFNQSTRLAQHLSRATGIPMNTRLLKRVLPTSTQTRLTRSERAENVKRAFAFHGAEPLTNARIVLVDDVLTTGATASACAKLLRKNGAAVIDVWTVARNILK